MNGFDYSRPREEFVIAVMNEDGSTALVLHDRSGKFLRTLTSGDSIDIKPRFSKRDPDRVLYQSAGIARDEEESIVGCSPMALMSVDIEKDKEVVINEVLSNLGFDLMVPADDMEGRVYFIKRPFEKSEVRLITSLIAPFHVFWALLRLILSLFGSRSQEAGAGAGCGESGCASEPSSVYLLGRTLALDEGSGAGSTSMVPKDWELCRLDSDGKEERISNSVAGFYVGSAGVVATNGFKIKLKGKAGITEVHAASLIEAISG